MFCLSEHNLIAKYELEVGISCLYFIISENRKNVTSTYNDDEEEGNAFTSSSNVLTKIGQAAAVSI